MKNTFSNDYGIWGNNYKKWKIFAMKCNESITYQNLLSAAKSANRKIYYFKCI